MIENNAFYGNAVDVLKNLRFEIANTVVDDNGRDFIKSCKL